ncbi:hypothetical protein ACFU1R_20460 [Priestia megaterium]|uniref:hypothetical protein n=1 Tax=Priestia megaterium TaxID=1404 RepID=UPI00366F746F
MDREQLISDGFIEKVSKSKTIYYVNSEGDVVARPCKKCGVIKTIDNFRKHNGGIAGKSASCIPCLSNSKGLRKLNNLENRIIDGVNTPGKTCIACDTWKPLDEFNSHRNMLAGKSSECKVCKSVTDKTYRKENKVKIAESMWKYQKENAERLAKYKREWLDRNPEKSRIRSQLRRDREAKLPKTITSEEKTRILSFFNGCALTGSMEDIVFDHVIPIATECGGSTYENLIPLTFKLTHSKSDSNLFEWFDLNRDRFNLSQEKFDFLVEYLAEINEMTIEEYREYYDGCFKKAED